MGAAAVLGGVVGGTLALGFVLVRLALRLAWRGRRWWVAPVAAALLLVAVTAVRPLPYPVQAAGWLSSSPAPC